MRVVFAFILALGLAGCSQPATVGGMSVGNVAGSSVSAEPGLIGTLAVGTVAGGEETNPAWTSEVDGPSFKAALTQSLLANALLNRDPALAPYILEANLTDVDQPMFGFTYDVTSTVAYRVIDKATGQAWYERTITATGSAGTGDALYAVDRLRIANERSIAVNIEKFIGDYVAAWKALPKATS